MGSTSPGDPPDRPADTEQVEDDPLAFLERFAAYLRDDAAAGELLAAAGWAAVLIEAVELGSIRARLGWPARMFPPSITVAARDLAAWARELELAPGRLIVP